MDRITMNPDRLDMAVRKLVEAHNVYANSVRALAQIDPVSNKEWRFVSPGEIEKKRQEIRDKTAETLNACQVYFDKFMQRVRSDAIGSIFPYAENLHNENARFDMDLLDRDIIETPAELEYMRKKYISANHMNVSMLRMIDRYAQKHGWDGFSSSIDTAAFFEACDLLESLSREFFAAPNDTTLSMVAKMTSGAEFQHYSKGGN